MKAKRIVSFLLAFLVLATCTPSLALAVRYGDINNDKTINLVDLAKLRLMIDDHPDGLPSEFCPQGDLDGDGYITRADYNLMKKYTVGLITVFPVEEHGSIDPWVQLNASNVALVLGTEQETQTLTVSYGGDYSSVGFDIREMNLSNQSVCYCEWGSDEHQLRIVGNGPGYATITVSTYDSAGNVQAKTSCDVSVQDKRVQPTPEPVHKEAPWIRADATTVTLYMNAANTSTIDVSYGGDGVIEAGFSIADSRICSGSSAGASRLKLQSRSPGETTVTLYAYGENDTVLATATFQVVVEADHRATVFASVSGKDKTNITLHGRIASLRSDPLKARAVVYADSQLNRFYQGDLLPAKSTLSWPFIFETPGTYWLCIELCDASGRVVATSNRIRHVVPGGHTQPTFAYTPADLVPAQQKTGTVLAPGTMLRVRSGPGSKYGVITTLGDGTQVSIVKKTGAWYHISSPVDGYVSAKCVRVK